VAVVYKQARDKCAVRQGKRCIDGICLRCACWHAHTPASGS
jgi:hypothetical protein